MSKPNEEAIRNDVATMVGGHFTGVDLGPQVYEDILARARANAGAYLETFQRLFLGGNFDPILQSNLHLPSFLHLMSEADAATTSKVAALLLKQYDAVLAFHDAVEDRSALYRLVPEETMAMYRRFESRRAELRQLMDALGQ